MTMSHSLVADAGDSFIENANCRRQIVEFGQWRDLAVPPPLHAAKPDGEVFDPVHVRRESEENKPGFVLAIWPSKKQNAPN
jgi:hypothetical protein